MVLLQHKLNLKVSQRQILTPGLVQMVSVLALNKLELKEMINAEIVENPVLEELDENIQIIDQVAAREEERERPEAPDQLVTEGEKKDPFEEIDFGTYFKDYLDPGFRSPSDFESSDRPSFENFLSKPGTLTDHLMWQLGSLALPKKVRAAAELVIGNLNEDGYLVASDEELMSAARGETMDALSERTLSEEQVAIADALAAANPVVDQQQQPEEELVGSLVSSESGSGSQPEAAPAPQQNAQTAPEPAVRLHKDTRSAAPFTMEELREGIESVRQMDPIGVAARDLRECLLLQLRNLEQQINSRKVNGNSEFHNQHL